MSSAVIWSRIYNSSSNQQKRGDVPGVQDAIDEDDAEIKIVADINKIRASQTGVALNSTLKELQPILLETSNTRHSDLSINSELKNLCSSERNLRDQLANVDFDDLEYLLKPNKEPNLQFAEHSGNKHDAQLRPEYWRTPRQKTIPHLVQASPDSWCSETETEQEEEEDLLETQLSFNVPSENASKQLDFSNSIVESHQEKLSSSIASKESISSLIQDLEGLEVTDKQGVFQTFDLGFPSVSEENLRVIQTRSQYNSTVMLFDGDWPVLTQSPYTTPSKPNQDTKQYQAMVAGLHNTVSCANTSTAENKLVDFDIEPASDQHLFLDHEEDNASESSWSSFSNSSSPEQLEKKLSRATYRTLSESPPPSNEIEAVLIYPSTLESTPIHTNHSTEIVQCATCQCLPTVRRFSFRRAVRMLRR